MYKKIILFLTAAAILIGLITLFEFNKKTETTKTLTTQNIDNVSSSTQIINTQELENKIIKSEIDYCKNNGGTIGQIIECGNLITTCKLKDGTDCGIKDYMDGSCKEGTIVEWGEACR